MSSFDENGITMDTAEETRLALSDDLKIKHGNTFKSDDLEAVAGSLVQIISAVIREQNEFALGIVDGFNPDSAKGFFLNKLVKFNGISRNESKYSTVPLDITAGSAATVVPAGSIVTDDDETVEWILDSDTALVAYETKNVSATANEVGSFEADPGTLTKIKTPVYSWESVTNTAAASPGQIEESDAELRARRETVSQAKGQCSEPTIFRELTEIENVESVNTYVNETEVDDPESGQPPKTIWCIVRGGSNDDIAEILAKNVAAGTITFGSIMVTYDDVLTDPNGVEYTKQYTRYFDRPDDITIYIDINLTKKSTYPVDGDAQIRQKIIDYFAGNFTIDGRNVLGFPIGYDVIYSELSSPVNAVAGHSINSLYANITGFGTGQSDIDIARNEQGFVSEANIRINGVTG